MCLAHTLKLIINKNLRIHPKKKVEEVMVFFFFLIFFIFIPSKIVHSIKIGVLMPQLQLFYFIESATTTTW